MELKAATTSEKSDRDRVTYAEWGRKLTPDQFLIREAHLRSQPWAMSRMTTWLWKAPDQTVLSSCETFDMDSFKRGQKALVVAIASVFTEPAMRGQGYARGMLQALLDLLDTERKPDATILFSDIGHSPYQQLGFTARPISAAVFKPKRAASMPSFRLLTPAEVIPLWKSLSPPNDGPCTQDEWIIWPTPEQVGWHLERETIYAKLLRRDRPELSGAQSDGNTILWTINHKEDLLEVLWMRASDPSLAGQLIALAQNYAAERGLGGVRAWESEEPLLDPRWRENTDRLASGEGSLPLPLPMIRGSEATSPFNWRRISRSTWV